jgi:fucose permease
MVIPLSRLSRHRDFEHHHSYRCLPIQNAGWYVFFSLFYIWHSCYGPIPECLVDIGQAAAEQGTSSDSTFRQILSHKTVHLLAFFILVYVGVEVTVGGSHFFDFVY